MGLKAYHSTVSSGSEKLLGICFSSSVLFSFYGFEAKAKYVLHEMAWSNVHYRGPIQVNSRLSEAQKGNHQKSVLNEVWNISGYCDSSGFSMKIISTVIRNQTGVSYMAAQTSYFNACNSCDVGWSNLFGSFKFQRARDRWRIFNCTFFQLKAVVPTNMTSLLVIIESAVLEHNNSKVLHG